MESIISEGGSRGMGKNLPFGVIKTWNVCKMCGSDEEPMRGGSRRRHAAAEVEKVKRVYSLGQELDSVCRFIWVQVSDCCLLLAAKKKKSIVPSLLSCRSPRGEGVDPTFLHADLIKPSAERKTGLDSWPCSTLHSIGASERTWWSKQHAAGNWMQLPRCCLFQAFFFLSFPSSASLFFRYFFLVSFLSGKKERRGIKPPTWS